MSVQTRDEYLCSKINGYWAQRGGVANAHVTLVQYRDGDITRSRSEIRSDVNPNWDRTLPPAVKKAVR